MNTYVDTALKIESLWSEVLIIDCSKDDLVINDLAFLLGTDCQGVCHRTSDRHQCGQLKQLDSMTNSEIRVLKFFIA